MTRLRARATFALTLVLTASSAAGASAQSLITAAPAPPPTGAIPGELLVGFEKGASANERAAARRRAKVKVKRSLRLEGVQLVEVEAGTSDGDAIASLEREGKVRYAERNHYWHAATISNDPLLGALWGLNNFGAGVDGAAALVDKDIDALEAWDVITGGDVLVAVVDEGIAYDHPDLRDNMWTNPGETAGNGVDDDGNGFVDDIHGIDTRDQDSDPRDTGGHGTHVAGTIAAQGNNGEGVVGVAWDARLMAVRAIGMHGGSDATVAEAFDYAGDMGARVVNASLGSSGPTVTMQNVLDAHPNTLFVVAAGNGGADGVGDDIDQNAGAAQYLCSYPHANLICVAATDQEDKLAGFSNFGTTSVDIAAPGTETLSSAPDRGKPIFSDDFAADDFATTWTPNGTGVAWGRADLGGGDFASADSPAGNYANSSESYSDATIDISGEGGCVLDFDLAGTLLAGDNFVAQINVDGAGWERLTETDRTAFNSGFFRVTRQLPHVGDSLGISFGVETDASGTADGIYVDNVVVRCVRPEVGAGDYEFQQGTSMATPHVAGAAALLFARNSHLSVAEARAALLESGDPVPGLAGKLVSVNGAARRLNVNTLVRLPSLGAIDPAVVTGTATAVSQTTATLGGTVDPRGTATSYKFQYGSTTAYGSETPVASAGAGKGAVPVQASLEGLSPATTYHYRLVAVRGDTTFPAPGAKLTTPSPDPGGTTGETPGDTTGGTTGGSIPSTTGGTTGGTIGATLLPQFPASLKGTAKPTRKRVKRAKVACVNASATKVTCKVTFVTAKKKRKVSGTLKLGAVTAAKGSVKKANGKGLVTLKGTKALLKGAYILSVKVGRKTYKFKVALG